MQQMQSNKPSHKVYYVTGVFHPPAKRKEEIMRDDADYDIYDKKMDQLCKDMIGKPITTNHPRDGDKRYRPSGEWHSNVRGKCVWTGKLKDGAYYFIGEMPLPYGNVKSRLTRLAIKRGELQSVSLGNMFKVKENKRTGEWDADYTGDHIAIVPSGTEYRPGCSVLAVSSKTVPVQLFSDECGVQERSKALVSMAGKISEENSDSIHQLAAKPPSDPKPDYRSDERSENTQTSDDNHWQSVTGMATASNEQMNGGGAPVGTTAQQMPPQQQQHAQQQAAAANQMTDDNAAAAAAAEGAAGSGNDGANDDYILSEFSGMSREDLLKVLPNIVREHQQLYNENCTLKQGELKKKQEELEQKKADIIDRLVHAKYSGINGDLTPENKKAIMEETTKQVNKMFGPMKQRKDVDIKTIEKKIDKKMKKADEWQTQLAGIAVASKQGAEEIRQLRAAQRSSGHERFMRNILRGGVRSQQMKQQQTSAVPSSLQQRWASDRSSIPAPSNTKSMHSDMESSSSSSSSSSSGSADGSSLNGYFQNLKQRFKPQLYNPDAAKRLMEESKRRAQAMKYMQEQQQYGNGESMGY